MLQALLAYVFVLSVRTLFLNCVSLKNIVSFFFFLKSISVTKETLSFLPLEQWEKKLCCLLGVHCPQRIIFYFYA